MSTNSSVGATGDHSSSLGSGVGINAGTNTGINARISKIFLINAHQPSDFSQGRLNTTMAALAREALEAKGYTVRETRSAEEWSVDDELEKHIWADAVILQSPVNWMGVPWRFKQYMDEVYTAGMGGQLCAGDGRTADQPKANYGAGGTLTGKPYLLSLTFNAPAESFDDPAEYLFQGRSVDDLFFPMHMNFRFFGMTALPTFACYDVLKNPTIEADFERYRAHLDQLFGPARTAAAGGQS